MYNPGVQMAIALRHESSKALQLEGEGDAVGGKVVLQETSPLNQQMLDHQK